MNRICWWIQDSLLVVTELGFDVGEASGLWVIWGQDSAAINAV